MSAPPSAWIVAEVSKNWIGGRETTPGSGLLAEQFERVIGVNHARGYVLHSFQIARTITGPDELNETIVAVFEPAAVTPAAITDPVAAQLLDDAQAASVLCGENWVQRVGVWVNCAQTLAAYVQRLHERAAAGERRDDDDGAESAPT